MNQVKTILNDESFLRQISSNVDMNDKQLQQEMKNLTFVKAIVF